MRRVAALLWATTTLSQDVCYPDYECQWSTYVAGTLYAFDFSHLCGAFGETIGAPPFTYRFNLCGRAPQYCLPLNGRQTFSRGTMIQFTDPATPPLACVRCCWAPRLPRARPPGLYPFPHPPNSHTPPPSARADGPHGRLPHLLRLPGPL
jgi:hypothetical protein